MKKLIYTFIASSMLAATVTSCIDLDQEPKSFITEEEYIEYPKDVESVAKGVSGLYNQLRGTTRQENTIIMDLTPVCNV